MHQVLDHTVSRGSDFILASDWGSLGRFVQASALEAIATHFAELGRSDQCQGNDASAGSESAE